MSIVVYSEVNSPEPSSLEQAIKRRFGTAIAGMYDFVTTRGLFQDADGTNPVTGYGQPIGLVRNRMLNSYEWEEVPPDTEGPAVFRQPDEPQITGVLRNLFLNSDNFEDAPWTKATGARDATRQNVDLPNVGPACLVTTIDAIGGIRQVISGLANDTQYTLSVYVEAGTCKKIDIISENSFAAFGDSARVYLDTETGEITGSSGHGERAVREGRGYRVYFTLRSREEGLVVFNFETRSRGEPEGGRTYYVSQPQFEAGPVATPYQAVRSPTDFDGSGLPVGSIWHKTNASDEVIGTYRFTGNPRPVDSSDLRQATTAARPTFTERGAQHDGVDDMLRAAIAADWGFLVDGSGGLLGVSGSFPGENEQNFLAATQAAAANSAGLSAGARASGLGQEYQGAVVRSSAGILGGGNTNPPVADNEEVVVMARTADDQITGFRGRNIFGEGEYDPAVVGSFPLSTGTSVTSPRTARRIIAIREAITDPADIFLLDAWLREGAE